MHSLRILIKFNLDNVLAPWFPILLRSYVYEYIHIFNYNKDDMQVLGIYLNIFPSLAFSSSRIACKPSWVIELEADYLCNIT